MRAPCMGEHINMLTSAHSVSALPRLKLTLERRLPHCRLPRCRHLLAVPAVAIRMAASQNSLPLSQVIHADADNRARATIPSLSAALFGVAVLVLVALPGRLATQPTAGARFDGQVSVPQATRGTLPPPTSRSLLTNPALARRTPDGIALLARDSTM